MTSPGSSSSRVPNVTPPTRPADALDAAVPRDRAASGGSGSRARRITAAGATWCTGPRSPSSSSRTRRPARRSRPRRQACPSRSAASATGTTGTRGSATVRSPSRRSTGSASPTTRSCSSCGCATGSRTAQPDASGPLRIMYRVDGSADLEEYDARPLGGLPRIGAGPHRQRRVRSTPTRHLRRSLRRGLSRRAQAAVDRQARLERPARDRRLGVRELGPARRGPLGGARRTPGVRVRPHDVLGRTRPGDPHGYHELGTRRRSNAGPRRAMQSTNRSSPKAGTHDQKALVQHYGSDVLDAAILAAPRLHYLSPTDEIWQGRWPRSNSNSCPTASCTATTPKRRPTACGAPRARSRCAPSGTSTRSPGRAGSKTPVSCSRRC